MTFRAMAARLVRRLRARIPIAPGALILAGLLLAGCPSSGEFHEVPHAAWDLRVPLSAAERAYLDSLPVLRLGTDPQWAPMAYVDEGGLHGISADYLEFIRDTLGIRLRIVPTRSWGETIELANQGGLDVVVAASSSDGLASGFRYSTPYVRYPLIIVTRETAPFIGGPADLAGSEVALVKDSEIMHAELPALRDMRRIVVATADEGLNAVASGRAFAYIGNLGVVDRLVREKYAGILRIAAPVGHIEELSFGIAPDLAPLRPLFNRVLAAIPEAQREHVQNSWLSTRFTFGIPTRTLWIVLTPLVVVTIVFVAVLWGYMMRLRKEVRQRRWTERELVFETQFKTLLMNTIPIPVFVKDAEGRYLSVNPAYEEAIGVRADALIGQRMPLKGPIHEDDVRTIHSITERVIETGEPAVGEIRYRSADGAEREAVYWVRLCKADDEMPRAVVGAFVEVSDLRRMERREIALKRQLVELTQALPAIVFQLDFVPDRRPRFTLVFANERVHEWLPRFRSLDGDTLGLFMRCLDADTRLRLLRLFLHSARSLQPVRAELALALGAGRTAWLNLEAAPHAREDGPVVWSGYLHDVTTAKETHAALIAAKHLAEDALRARDVFLATVSHEIRTPMSGVVGILQLLDHGRLAADDQHLLDMARSAAEILLRILNDILDFAKTENGDLTLTCAPMSVADIVQRTAGIAEPELKRKGLGFEVKVSRDLAPRHIGDAHRVGQVLLNLLGNAAKFTDDGAVMLSVDLLSRTDNEERILIEVADTGIGISKEDQARLFSPFTQAQGNAGHRSGGTGLGLAICKRLVQCMRGSIRLESEIGRGTTVSIELPLPVDPTRPSPPRGKSVAANADGETHKSQAVARRILIVEDQAINREVVVRQLAHLGIVDCDVAENGAEALSAMEGQSYAMVITDCAMPVMNGVELIRRIRQREIRADRRTVVVALTANAMRSQRDECLAAGADEVFIKPIDPENLRALLERYGMTPARIAGLQKADIPPEHHADLWERLQQTLAAELAALLSLSIDNERDAAREVVHRIAGAAAWFQLDEVAQAAAHLEMRLTDGGASPADLVALRTAIARAAGEPASTGSMSAAPHA